MKLIDERTPDGSRHFAMFPQFAAVRSMRDHTLLLDNAALVNYVDKDATSPWFDFTFRGHRFLIHCHEGHYWLCVQDPQCPDLILFEVGSHFERLIFGEKK